MRGSTVVRWMEEVQISPSVEDGNRLHVNPKNNRS